MVPISVVIPVYNAEKYIQNCVESILSQSFQDFEIILVDDGSKDASSSICDTLSNTFLNIKTIHTENHGASSARHTGVKSASGQWVMFVDADDCLPAGALSSLVENCSECDVVIGGVKHGGAKTITPQEWVKGIIDSTYLPSLWAKLFKTELLDDYVFNVPRDFVYGEDMASCFRIAAKCSRIRVIEAEVYIYDAYVNGSVSASFNFTMDYAVRSFEMFSPDLKAAGCDIDYLDALYIKLMRKALEAGNFQMNEAVSCKLRGMDPALLNRTRKGLLWKRILLSPSLRRLYLTIYRLKNHLSQRLHRNLS